MGILAVADGDMIVKDIDFGRPWKRIAETHPLRSSGLKKSLLSIPEELLHYLFQFLDFRSISSFLCTTSKWKISSLSSPDLWSRLAKDRWPSVVESIDRGTGPSAPFDLRLSISTIKDRCIFREKFLDHSPVEPTISLSFGKYLIAQMERHLSDDLAFDEILRIFEEYFDHPKDEISYSILKSVECSSRLRRGILNMFALRFFDSKFLTLGIKFIGMISINEKNRKSLPSLGVLDVLISAIEEHFEDKRLIQVALWSLVIIARPLGSSEGAPFVSANNVNTANVAKMMSENGIQLIVQLIRKYERNPEILSKCFWSLVNLALLDQNKQEIFRLNGIQMIVKAMRNFPFDEELQHRACFCLINLSIPSEFKDEIRIHGGLKSVVHALLRFKTNFSIVRCASNVILSLIWENIVNKNLLREMHDLRVELPSIINAVPANMTSLCQILNSISEAIQ